MERTLRKVKVGVVQATPVLFNIGATTDLVISWIEKAAEERCEVVLFPESFIPCYPRGLNFDAVVGKRTEKSRDRWLDYWQNSVEADSETVKRIGEAAKKAGIFVALGVTEREKIGGSLYCSLFYFDSNGQLAGKHRKLKPTGLERYVWSDGQCDTLTSFSTPFGILGGLICWENYMPLARMALYQKGIEIWLAPTADTRPSWQSTMQHIALEGRCFVLSANQLVRKSDYPDHLQDEIKDEPELMSTGGSVIISPFGQILAGPLWGEEGLLTAELDFSDIVKSKLELDVIGHYGRNDSFKLEVNGQPDPIKIR